MIGKPFVLICALALVNIALAGNSDPSQAPAICSSQGSDSILVAHEDCGKFYKCYRGKPTVLDCPPNLLYNPDREYCDWPENVNCKAKDDAQIEENDNNVNEQGNKDPSKAPEICGEEGSDGVLVAHEQCNKFYKCSESKPVVLECPENLLYNAGKEYCDWAENVDCKAKDEIQIEENDNDVNEQGNNDPSKAPEICAEEGSDGVLVAHEQCNKFYSCSDGKPAVLECPGNLVYNADKKYCDWAENVDCKAKDEIQIEENDNDVNEQGNNDPSIAPEICAEEGSDGVLVAHEQCNKFYKCSESKPVVLECPGNLLYNAGKEYCDWAENVDCKAKDEIQIEENDNDVNEQGNNDPSKAPEICAEEGSDGVLVAHEQCNKFYKCSESKPVVLECPENLLYNAGKEYCDWAENVDCKAKDEIQIEENDNDVNEQGNNDPSKAPEICAEEGSDGVLVAHEQCNKFYKCSESKPVVLDCPENLFYNSEREYCDWLYNVDCGNRS